MNKVKINYEKTYYFLMLFFAFTLPISKALTSLCIIFFILIWLLEGRFKEKFSTIKKSKISKWTIGFCLLCFIGVFYAYDFSEGIKVLKKYLYLLLIPIIASSIKKEWIDKILNAFLSGMFVVVVYAISPLVYKFSEAMEEFKVDHYYFDPTMLSITWSIFLAFTCLVLLIKMFKQKQINKKTIWLFIFFFLAILNLALSFSRTGQLAFLIVFFAYLLYKFRFSFKTLLLSSALIVSLAFVALNFGDNFLRGISNVNQALEEKDYNSSWGIRMAYYSIAMESFKQNPIFGAGVSSYKEETKKVLSKEEFSKFSNIFDFLISHDPHNQYLLTIMELGIVGLLVLLRLFYVVLLRIKVLEKQEHKEIFFAFMLIFILSCFSDSQFLSNGARTLFIIFVGILSSFEVQKFSKT